MLPSTICTVSAPRIGNFRGSMAGLRAPLSTLRRGPHGQAKVTGLDGADAVLEIAGKEILQHSSLANRVDIRKWLIGRQENPLGSEGVHAVVSNSLLHHMHDPLDLWRAIRACAAPGAAVLVMDLIRPRSRIEAENIVEKYAGKEPELLRNDFLNSLLAVQPKSWRSSSQPKWNSHK
jgi:SAM-dependent methyltransferase